MPRPQDPVEVNKENSNAVVENRTEEIQEKEGERKIKEEPQETIQQEGEQNPAEKDQGKGVSDDMPKVKEDSAGKSAETHNQLPLQDSDKQSAATSLLAQLLGNVNAQAPLSATPEYLPRTPLPEPLTDASTPAAHNEDLSLPLIYGQTEGIHTSTQQPDIQNGEVAVPKQEENTTTEAQNQTILQTNTAFNDIQDDSVATRIPDMVTGVMEDPLSKTSHDHNALFAPFDDGSMKNGLDALQQHDLLSNAFLSQEINMSGLPDLSSYSQYDVAASIAGSEPRIQAFAKLEFDDGHFYVNTYSFILGRDVRAARAAFQREVQVRQAMRPSRNKSSSGGNTSHTPNRVKRDGSAYVGSVVSDRGGIMGFDPDVPHHISQMSRRSSVSSQPDSVLHATPAQLQANHTDYNALAMQSLYDGSAEAKPVDMLALLPSPDACPTIPIHPPATADGSSAGHKGISRKHVKIAYNFDKNLFEMEVMGRNGAFIGADWLAPGQLRPLHSGDYIQIGGVRIRFLLPDVPIGETGADRLEEPLLEDGAAVTGEVTEAATGDVDAMEGDSDDESQDGTKRPRVTKLILKTKSQDDSANADASIDGNGESSQPKRRGPGRPPKDGIMSKRERAEIAREQKLAAKREANGGVTPPPPINRPKPPTTTKPTRKEDSVEEVEASAPATPAAPTTPSKPVEKKSVKRKQPDGSIVDIPIESIEGGEQQQPLPEQQPVVEYPKPPPPKKRKPSRSPSPDYPPESAYTQDQMAKPPYNYAVLIFDALTESRTPMTLKQIYRALKLKYPYFRFKCETEGWTSSVRHNLNGNRQLFEHAERDGKGWSWQLRAGASVEKEKKRRPSPPLRQHIFINLLLITTCRRQAIHIPTKVCKISSSSFLQCPIASILLLRLPIVLRLLLHLQFKHLHRIRSRISIFLPLLRTKDLENTFHLILVHCRRIFCSCSKKTNRNRRHNLLLHFSINNLQCRCISLRRHRHNRNNNRNITSHNLISSNNLLLRIILQMDHHINRRPTTKYLLILLHRAKVHHPLHPNNLHSHINLHINNNSRRHHHLLPQEVRQ